VMRRFSFTCSLIIRLDYPSILDEQEIIQTVGERNTRWDIPVIWNLRKGALVPPGAERNILSQGKYGIPHALLRPEELHEELLFRDAGSGEIPEYLFPAAVDPYRSSMRELYSRRSRLFVDAGKKALLLDRESVRSFPLVRVADTGERELKALLRRARRASMSMSAPALLLYSPASIAECGRVFEHLTTVLKKERIRVRELKELLELPGVPSRESWDGFPTCCRLNPLPAGPLNRFRRSIPWRQPSEGRLFLLARNHRTDSSGYEGTEHTPRGLIAHMPGEAAMGEGKVSVMFSRGELSSIEYAGKPAAVPFPGTPLLETGRTKADTARISSFSFQDEPVRGLRDTVHFNSALFDSPGRLVRDYFFVADDERLCFSCFIRYPRISQDCTVSRLALCEIPLAVLRGGEGVPAAVDYPDGERAETLLYGPGEYLLYGSRFRFALPACDFVLEFAESQGVVHELPVSLRQAEGGSLALYLNPGGSYWPLPAASLSLVEEQFSLIMSIEKNGSAPESITALLPYLEQYRVALDGSR
jgi:hypothetical protein